MPEYTPSQLAEDAQQLHKAAFEAGEEETAAALAKAAQKFTAIETAATRSKQIQRLAEGKGAAEEAYNVTDNSSLANSIEENLMVPFGDTNSTDTNASPAQ